MAAMSEEENLWQESVGGITMLESEPLEAMDSARVLATIDVAQEASAHGSSASREIVGVPDPLSVTELQATIRGNRARKKVISQQNAALDLAGAAALGGYVTNSLFTWQSESKQKAKHAQEHQKLASRTRTMEEVRSLKDEAVAKVKHEREELAARDQAIAPTSHALAAAPRPRIFGEAEWKQYFGDVGSAPDLPSDIATILDGPCPFWPDQLVKDTHLLVLIPAAVGGVPFTLNLLGELIQHPSHGGHKTEYRYYNERVKAQIGAASPPRSYWVLMTHDVLPGSRGARYADQKKFVAGYASREGVPYALPSVLEAATAILMHHARAGERLFGDHPRTYTRCQEVVYGRDPAVVGGFESSGPFVLLSSDAHDFSGAACCRKF